MGAATSRVLAIARTTLVLVAAAALVWTTAREGLGTVPAGTFVVFAALGLAARLTQPRYPGATPRLPVALVFVGAGAILLGPVVAMWLAVVVGLAGLVRGDPFERVVVSASTLVLSAGAAGWFQSSASGWFDQQPVVGGAAPFGGPVLEVAVTAALFTGLVLTGSWIVLRWVAHWIDQRAPARIIRRRVGGRWRADLLVAAAAVVAALLWAIHPPAIAVVLVPATVLWGRRARADERLGVDELTGLASSSSLRVAMVEELTRAEQFDRPVSILVVDIDAMAALNDAHGFEGGDEILEEVAERLRAVAREYDLVARIGPDAFVVLMPDATTDGAKSLGERVVAAISAEPVPLTEGGTAAVTASVGLATYPGDASEREALLTEAELAANFASLEGGNRSQAAARLPAGFRSPRRASSSDEATDEVLPVTEPVGPDRLVRAVAEPLADARPRTDRLLIAVGALAVLAAVAASWWAGGPVRFWTLVLFAGLAVGAEWFAESIYGRANSSWSAVPLIALALLPETSGLSVSVAAVAPGLGGGVVRRVRPRQALYNAATLTLASLAAFVVAERWPGTDGLALLEDAGRGMVAGGAFFVVDTALVAVAVALATRTRVRQVWRDDLMWLVPHQLGMGLIGGVMAYAHEALSVAGVLVLAIPALGLHVAQRQFVGRTRENVVRLRRLNDDMRDANQRVVRVNERLTEALEQVNSGYLVTVESLARAVDAKDSYTGSHIDRVEAYGRRLLEVVDPELTEDEALLWGFRLHDVGKIGVPDSVLRKPGPLDEEEWEVMKRHPEIGAEIIASAPFLESARAVVLHHHERWDGRGYPYGLAERAIPFSARLFSVVDAYDAMTSDRPYRSGMDVEQAVQELVRNAATQFDPEMVEAFIQIPLDDLESARQEVQRIRSRARESGKLIEIASPEELEAIGATTAGAPTERR
ncbi:MAG: diguanylate cyclase [Nitriliruptorales bacterium]|nr:diguanylate cyclase [Nitriliruptorales bacterium]